MPPQLALVLGLIFITALIITDPVGKGQVSRAALIPLVWLLIICSRYPSFWFAAGQRNLSVEQLSEGSPLDRNVFLLIILAGVVVLVGRKVRLRDVYSRNRLLIIYFLFALISLLWSDFGAVVFKRWIKASGLIVMVMVLVTDESPDMAIRWVLRRLSFILIPLSIVLIRYFPMLGKSFSPFTGQAEVAGVAMNKNGLGYLCLVLGIYFFWEMITISKDRDLGRKKFLIDAGMIVLILWMLKLANSATSTASLIAAVFWIIILSNSSFRKSLRRPGLLLIGTLVIFLLLQAGFNIAGTAINSMGRDMTLTNRAPLWNELLHFPINPLVGVGFESFWLGKRLQILWARHWWHPNQAHNGYLEIYLNLGLVGLSIMLALMYKTFNRVTRMARGDQAMPRLMSGFLIMTLLYNITEAGLNAMHLIWFIFILTCLYQPAGYVDREKT